MSIERTVQEGLTYCGAHIAVERFHAVDCIGHVPW